ncbi:MAG: VTC domain-containing protein, partial [Bacilli bacterium]|nr:VTC domain-containing protein [Bacilli bacterium]
LAIFKERYRGSIVPNTIMQYDRVAYMNKPGEDYLRLTVDRDIRYRREDFEINKIGGKSLLKEGYGILEIKFIGAMPLFVAKALNDLGLQRQTFSKFGSSYLNEAKEARLL